MWSIDSLTIFRSNVVALQAKQVSISASVLLSLLDSHLEVLRRPIAVRDDE